MLDSIYHMTLKLLKDRSFGIKTSRLCHLFHNVKWTSLRYVTKSVNHYRDQACFFYALTSTGP